MNGQEAKNVQQDTSRKRPGMYNLDIYLPLPGILPIPSTNVPRQSISDFLHQSLSVPLTPFSWTYKTNIELETTWQKELARQNEYKTLKTIMGSVQMGGAAYLMYLHFKKYGLK